MNNKYKLTTSLLTAMVLAGCGAESTVNVVADPAPPLVGQFVDAPVAGLQFKITRQASGVDEVITGVTDANGNFEYYRGDSVTFHIGDIEFPATAGANFITPLQVFKYDTPFNTSVTNALVLLQSLDSDGDPENGISISEDARTVATMNLADGETLQDFFEQEPDDFAADVETWIAGAGTTNTEAVKPADAQLHFVNYVDSQLSIKLVNPFDVSKFSGVVFNPTVVNQQPVTHSYEFTPANDDNLNGNFVYTDADTSVAPISGTYQFVFGRNAIELTAGDEVSYLIARSYNTVNDVYSLCRTNASDDLASLVQDCAFEDDAKVDLLTFTQAQTDLELIALDEKKDDVGVELIEAFDTTTETFLTSSYRSLSKKLADRPLYVETGGNISIDDTTGQLQLAGARFVIGNAAPLDGDSQPETAATDTVGTGIYNISEGFTISFDIVAHGTGGSLSLYVDNNTTSQGNSLHGDPSKFFGKSFDELTTWSEFEADPSVGVGKFTYTYVPGDDVVNGANSDPATDRGVLNTAITNSFFQFRTDSAGDITIDNLRIDTVADTVDASDLFIPPSAITFNDTVDFSANTDVDMFSPEYLNLAGEATSGDDQPGEADNIAMFTLTGGTVAQETAGVALTGGRFTMGDYLPSESTTAADANSSGVLDLSRPYQIVLTIDSVTQGGSDDKFEIYVDNDTSVAANSVHGADSLIYQSDVAALVAGEMVIDNDGAGIDIGTAKSFLQFLSTGTSKVVIASIAIEPYVPPVPIKVSLPYEVDFSAAVSADNLFTAEYQAVDGEAGVTGDDTPMFYKTGGTVVVDSNSVVLDNSRFTIGNHTPESGGSKLETSADHTTTTGVFDLSRPYKISFDVIDAVKTDTADSSTSFMIYVDNNTSSSGKSIHGSASKFYSIDIEELTAGTTVTVDGFIATATSFIQLRAESGAKIELNNLRIEYADPNVFFEETFENNGLDFFSTEYRALPNDGTTPMYFKTGGTAEITENNTLLITADRFTIGHSVGEKDTTTDADTATVGVFDFSKPYKIVFDVINAEEPTDDKDNSFLIYMDNNTSSSSRSIHGGDSKFYAIKIADMTPGTYEVEGFIGTATSFLQFRAESGANVEIDNLRFEYLSTNEVLSEDFETTSDAFFTPEYKASTSDSSKALYTVTSGSSRLTVTDGQLTIDNARFSIGETNPEVETAGTDTSASGELDLSKAYKITFDVISASEPDSGDQGNSFMMYVDNNTSSGDKSMHGGDSKFYSIKIADMTAGTVEVDGFVATANSFIQLRAESGAVVVIDNFKIEYLENSASTQVEPQVFSCAGRSVYFCDDFASGTLDNWDIYAADGNVSGPEGVFDVIDLAGNHVMRYTAGGLGGVLATLKDAALANVPANDYFVEAKIRPRQNGTTANKQLFLLARYQDNDNWYGGGLNLQNAVASTQVEVATNIAGALSRPVQSKKPLVLGERDATDDGTWYQVRFEVSGNDLTVYLNGELIGTHTDTNLTAKGLVGIFTYNRSFELDDVIIGDASEKPLQLTIDSDETSWFAAAGSAALIVDVTATLGDGSIAGFTAGSSDGNVATVFAGNDYISINPVAEGTVTITLVANDDPTISRSITLEVGPSFVESSTDYGDIASKLMPAPNSIGEYIDTSLSIEFDNPPSLGTVGKIRIYDRATDVLVDELNVADDTDTLGLTSVGTRTLKYKPARVDGNKLIIKPHTGALAYNKEYYVVIGNDVALNATLNGVAFDGIGQNIGWSFTTRAAAPTGTEITVDDDGFADFRTLQGALNYAMSDMDTPMTITLKDGEYHELLFLRNKNNLTIQGESRENTIVQYENYEGYNGGSSGRPVFLVEGSDMLVLNNFTLKNLHKRAGSGDQAETIYFNSGNRLVANNMNFISEQDTLLLKGYSWFYNSLVAGNVDFIWGYPVAALFEASEIRTIGDSKDAPSDSGGDYILQARVTDPAHPGFVFLNSEFTRGAGPMGNNVLDNSTYFARSSGKSDAYDNIVLINNKIGDHIAAAGWYTDPMPNPANATATAGWREYGSMDAAGNSLDISNRTANVAYELSAPEASVYSDRASVFASWNANEGWHPAPLDAPTVDDVVVATGDGGFAGYSFNLTGGAGGEVVTVDTGVALQNALASAKSTNTPITIYVDGVITNANSGNIGKNIDIKDMDNVSIIGVADRGELSGIGFSIRRANNIIIRNLKIHNVPASFGDAIGIEGDDDGSTTGHIWIDHNELYGDLNVGKDDYDGLVDSKAGAANITVSYNYMHDHYKSMLNGSSDDDSTGDRNITYHHNYFKNLESRVPLFRYGYGHLYNNVFENINSTAINSRMGAELLIESNVFINVQNPIVSFYSREIGFWNVRDNDFASVTWTTPATGDERYDEAVGSTSSFEVPYSYDGHLMATDQVANYVAANVGVGVIDQSNDDIPAIQSSDNDETEPGVYATLPYDEDFEVANSSIFFDSSYRDLSGAAGTGTPMYHKVTGTVAIDNGQLTMTGARISIGNTTPTINTTASDGYTGIFDLSLPYQVSFTVVSVADDTSRNFQIYVDNNTTSSGNSANGSGSKFHSVTLDSLVPGQTYTVDGLVASANSFITLRTEGGATITLEDISISY